MFDFISNCKNKRVFLIGIGGISMSAIAKYLLDNDFTVFGTDINHTMIVDDLILKGVNFVSNKNKKILKDVDVVIYSSAISYDNFWLKTAREHCIPIIKRSEILGSIINRYKNSIGISGSHGKTTATAMISEIFIKARKQPTIFLGGESFSFGNYQNGINDYIIYEACEFKKNFLDMKPKYSVVLNIDNDHVDTYSNIGEQIEAFSSFMQSSVSFINADDKYCNNINSISSITYGVNNKAVYSAKNINNDINNIAFDLYKHNKKVCKIELDIGGFHNVYNALVAYAVADYFKIEKEVIIKTLKDFRLVKRRNEYLGDIGKTKVFADYAHHPSELLAIFNQYKEINDRTLFVFQPHTYSRTKVLIDDFVNVLSKFKNILIYKTYSAREVYDYEGSAEFLADRIAKKRNLENLYYNNINEILSEINKYNTVVFLGAGDIYDIVLNFIEKTLYE